MFSAKLNQVIFLLIFHGYDCQRRIQDGTAVTEDKKYVVYLIKAQISPRDYEGWVCGGALVSSEYIVTSAACVTDVVHLYAIAGYNKYISELALYTDPCTKDKKKKIVFICTPKDYELVYTRPERWTNIDIAMVKVESPYDFTDSSYSQLCSYTPAPIEINFDPKYQEPGIDAIVLGWGHRTSYREEMDITNQNVEMLNYAPTLIEDKEECKKGYENFPGMDEVIDKYMICTLDKGNLNDAGATIVLSAPTAQGCSLSQQHRLRGEISCEDDGVPQDQAVLIESARKDLSPTNFSRNNAAQKSKLNSEINSNVVVSYSTHNSSLINKIKKTVLHSIRSNTRRNGICQNDHGGPLVTWVGAHEKLIGVASAYKITENRECIGPYLYTSTQCNGAFLDCILKGDPTNNPERRDICRRLLNEQGFKLVEQHISWEDHPDGPAENEKNGTAPVFAVNTDTNNVTVNLTSKEEINKTYQEHNATKFVNITNTNYTTTTQSIIDTNLTKSTKSVNVGDSTPMNLININSTNLKKSASVNFTSGNSTNLINNTFTALTIENSKNTILIKNATTNDRNATNTNFRSTTTNNINLETTNTNLIKNATQTTINLVDITTKN